MTNGKIKLRSLSKKEKKEIFEDLLKILLVVDKKEDLMTLILGALTDSELAMLSNRIKTAKKIFENSSERKIKEDLGVGFSTIKTVNNLLDKDNDEFRKVLDKYFAYVETDNFKLKKGGLHNYPGYDLALKLLGIEALDKYFNG